MTIKLYKGEHDIKITKEVNASHVPLAYMKADTKDYMLYGMQEKSATGIRKVIPYERFTAREPKFFSSDKEIPRQLADLKPVDATLYLEKDDSGYYYKPDIFLKCEPVFFNYTFLCQRTQTYTRNRIYNQRISCVDQSFRLVNALASIFSDAPDRGLAPHNVWVNEKNTAIESLCSRAIADNDMVFIETKDGETYTANGEAIDYDTYLSSHTNIWLCCSDIHLLEKSPATLHASKLYNESLYCNNHTFIHSSFNDKHLPEGGETLALFEGEAVACIVRHYPNKGYIVISSDQFIARAEENYKMIYEIMMQVYLVSYVKSETLLGYVCEIPIDYSVIHNQLIPHHHFKSDKPYYTYLGSYSTEDYRFIETVVMSDENIEASQVSGFIYFSLLDKKSNIQKPSQCDAVLLPNKEVAFIRTWHYIAETPIDYTLTRYGNQIDLTIEPFCVAHTHQLETLKLQMDLGQIANKKLFYLIAKDGHLVLTPKDEWDNTGEHLYTFTLSCQDAPITLVDMRVRGGGLPTNKEDNYRLLDMGHIQGRPFRKSGAFVVKLPTEARIYHDDIVKKIKQVSLAERFFTILYEDRKDGHVNDENN